MSENLNNEERYPSILIMDFGSQYSELIARRIREANVFSLVISHLTSYSEIKVLNPKGIILSGGPSSVYENHAPLCDEKIFNLGIPILGICYGMQLMVRQLGGDVTPAKNKAEYGRAPLYIDSDLKIGAVLFDKRRQIRWAGLNGKSMLSHRNTFQT